VGLTEVTTDHTDRYVQDPNDQHGH